MKLALVIDFDGTITDKDVGVFLLDTFSIEDWHEYERRYLEGEINLRECLAGEYTTLPADEVILVNEALLNIDIRDGFIPFVKYCEEKGWPITIVSGGLDFYIKAILDWQGLSRLRVVSGHADFSKGPRVYATWGEGPGSCEKIGTCKCYYIEKMISEGYQVVFIGDGITDTCAADKADYIFARQQLQTYCLNNDIPFSQFNDFYDIKRELAIILKKHRDV
jgi:2,3-diketo-5-methylthio-1-phosphopentane phosphatase